MPVFPIRFVSTCVLQRRSGFVLDMMWVDAHGMLYSAHVATEHFPTHEDSIAMVWHWVKRVNEARMSLAN